MPALRWRSFRTAEPDRDYLALLSELPLKSYLALPRFLRFTRQVQRQLKTAPGLVGYSLLARLWRKQFWTLSVWEDEQALMDFVNAVPHRAVMPALQPDMGETQFLRWTIRGDAYPPSWEAALARTISQSPGGLPSPP
ncbi:MAG TPA: antibiotic biosynthesis monooxygenase [Candidatus Acidoferrum sp.]|nr:antibiotic biosynthesis monooxygenase [Candidatus Acidoferrum sp.]